MRRPGLSAVALVAAIGACRSGGEGDEKPAPVAAAARAEDGLAEKLRHCPLTVDGVEVGLSDVAGGVRFELIARSESAVAELRRRAHHMSEFAAGRGREQHGGGKGGGFMRNCPVVSRDTAVVSEDTHLGVDIVVTATSSGEVEKLRAETRRRLDVLHAAAR